MADEVVKNEAVSSTVADSAPATNQNGVTNPPTVENTESHSSEPGPIPYARFQEVIHEKNREKEMRSLLEARLKDMEGRLPSQETSRIDSAVKKLVDGGLSEQAAKLLIDSQREIAQSEKRELEQRLRMYEVHAWNGELQAKYKDYKDVLPEVEKEFDALSVQEKHGVMASRRSYENFFKAIRSDSLEKRVVSAFNAGTEKAYENQSKKQAVSGGTGGGKAGAEGKSALTRQLIKDMSPDEYRKRLPEINEAIRNRTLK